MRRLSAAASLLAALALSPGAQATPSAGIPAAVVRAVSAGSLLPEARVEAVGYRGAGRCAAVRAELERPIEASGSVSLRIEGRGPAGEACRGFAVAEARVYAPVWVANRALATGESLEGAAARVEREVQPGHAPLAVLAPGLAASRPVAAGTVLEAGLVEDPAWRSGAQVRVVIRSGALSLSQQGRVVSCGQGRACAQLPSGRRVEGRRSGNELVLEMP
jgi:hypothetical protein